MASSTPERSAKSKTSSRLRGTRSFLGLALARGVALFFGVYSLANALTMWRSTHPSQDIWWIDLGVVPKGPAIALGVASALLLVAFGIAPRMAPWRRWSTAAACASLSVIALVNVTAFYRLWGARQFVPAVPVPLSLLIAVAFATLAWSVSRTRPTKLGGPSGTIAAVAVALLVAAVFPLAQIAFFGTSDYRAKSDAAVIFGAKVETDGRLSTSLADRMSRGIELHRRGLVGKLVMSGGVGASGVDEAAAMRASAEKAGVPRSDILLDSKGVDTDATVRNTQRIFRDNNIGSVLVVSQFYHLPRIKLAYRAAGRDVRTVPAAASRPIEQTPLFVVREIPAFWLYWGRAFARDVLGG